MKNIYALFLIFTSISVLGNVPFRLSVNQLNFATLNENSRDSLPITITNDYAGSLRIQLQFFGIFQDTAFSVSPNDFTLPQGGSRTVHVRFAPKHNVRYETAMMVQTTVGAGWAYSRPVYLSGNGVYTNAYYATSTNLSGEALKQALRTKMNQGFRALSYNEARDSMYLRFDNWATNGRGATSNTLECVYTGRQISGYTSRTQVQNTPNDFNCEHTFPQSFFSSASPMISDMHHLFPTDNNANNQRANTPFGVVMGAPTWSQGGSKLGGGVFEPRDVHKGAVARAMLYFGIMYGGNSTVQINYLTSQEPTLKSWTNQFPPNAVDVRRNNDIARAQGNRNPLVDYPQFLQRMGVLSTNSDLPRSKSYWVSATRTSSSTPSDEHRISIYNTGTDTLILGGSGSYSPANGFLWVSPGTTVIPPNSYSNMGFFWSGGTDSIVVPTNKAAGDRIVIHLFSSLSAVSLLDAIRLNSWENEWEILDLPSGKISISLMDVQGRMLQHKETFGNQIQLSKEGLPQGIYVVKVRSEKGERTWKVRR